MLIWMLRACPWRHGGRRAFPHCGACWPRRWGWRANREPTPRRAIIVTQFGAQVGGWIVDSVSDIAAVSGQTLQVPPPGVGNDSVVPFLEGLAAIDDKMVMVLNLAALTGEAKFAVGA